jgi:hypothetical protein
VNAVLLALLAASPAAEKSDMSPHQTRLMIRTYGDCVVKKQHRRAAEAIAANADNSTLMRKYPQLIDGTCVPLPPGTTVRVKFEGDQYRYALADALVRSDFAAAAVPSFDAVPRLDHETPKEPSRTDSRGRPLSPGKYQGALQAYQKQQAFALVSLYGECVVRADPAAARALLATDPESSAEMAQLTAMHEALATCLPEGTTVSFDKLVLRGTIAVNYYRLAKAALAQQSAGTTK